MSTDANTDRLGPPLNGGLSVMMDGAYLSQSKKRRGTSRATTIEERLCRFDGPPTGMRFSGSPPRSILQDTVIGASQCRTCSGQSTPQCGKPRTGRSLDLELEADVATGAPGVELATRDAEHVVVERVAPLDPRVHHESAVRGHETATIRHRHDVVGPRHVGRRDRRRQAVVLPAEPDEAERLDERASRGDRHVDAEVALDAVVDERRIRREAEPVHVARAAHIGGLEPDELARACGEAEVP